MSCSKAPEIHCKTIDEVRLASVSFINKLDDGELLTGTPTVLEVTTTDLTITNISVNTSNITINNVEHLPGQVVQYLVAGGLVNTYEIDISVGTDSVPAQTLDATVTLKVVTR